MWQNGLKILLRAIVGHGPKTGDLPSVWLDTCGSLPYQPDALARVAASPSQGFAGSKASRGQALFRSKEGRRPADDHERASRGRSRGPALFSVIETWSQGRRVGGHQDEPCLRCSRMRWVMPMSSLSSLELAKARSTRRTRWLTLLPRQESFASLAHTPHELSPLEHSTRRKPPPYPRHFSWLPEELVYPCFS